MSDKIIWQSAGGEIELLPANGRVLQARVGEHRAFWTNDQWSGDWNAGGDRLWLGPEVSWFWKSVEKFDVTQHEVPAAIDPGAWHVISSDDDHCNLEQEVLLRHRRREAWARVHIERRFAPVDLAEAPLWKSQVAYETANTLRILDGTPGERIDLWSISQVPAGGSVFVGARQNAVPRDYFTPITDESWSREGVLLRFEISGETVYKIGLAPGEVSGRMAYARLVEDEYFVILREFCPQAWRLYADVPMNDLGGSGDAIQLYNDDGTFGGFGEMEFHSPALEVGRGPQVLQDVSLCVVGTVAQNDWSAWQEFWLRGA